MKILSLFIFLITSVASRNVIQAQTPAGAMATITIQPVVPEKDPGHQTDPWSRSVSLRQVRDFWSPVDTFTQ